MTFIPAKLIGGAMSPPKPCPNTSLTNSGTEKIPINAKISGKIVDNYISISSISLFKDAIEFSVLCKLVLIIN